MSRDTLPGIAHWRNLCHADSPCLQAVCDPLLLPPGTHSAHMHTHDFWKALVLSGSGNIFSARPSASTLHAGLYLRVPHGDHRLFRCVQWLQGAGLRGAPLLHMLTSVDRMWCRYFMRCSQGVAEQCSLSSAAGPLHRRCWASQSTRSSPTWPGSRQVSGPCACHRAAPAHCPAPRCKMMLSCRPHQPLHHRQSYCNANAERKEGGVGDLNYPLVRRFSEAEQPNC
jgi:hypothetical protein